MTPGRVSGFGFADPDLPYDARIARAEYLKNVHPFATEILSYYASVCADQKNLASRLQAALKPVQAANLGDLREQIDVDRLVPLVRDTLAPLQKLSPAPLAASMEEFLAKSEAQRAASLQDFVGSGGKDDAPGYSREQLVAAILVQPYAELLAPSIVPPPAVTAGNLCPRCEARPVIGVLRVEGEGGKRFLFCSFCGSEWEFRRLLCAYCGETREQSLPVFVAEAFPHIRIEACDTCHHCLRTVDLTKDGNAVPVVDDLAAIPLALWAEEHGYTRIHNNLLGT